MTQIVISNNVNTQLAVALTNTGTTITLASSANLPTLSAGQIMPLTLNDAATRSLFEIVYVTAIVGVTLTVLRAQEGTSALNWSIGDSAYCAPTAGTVATVFGNPNNQFMVAPPTASNQAAPVSSYQNNAPTYAVDASTTANAIALTLTPAVTTYVDGMVVYFKAKNSNTGSTNINFGGGLISLVGGAGALEGGEIIAGAQYAAIYNATTNTATLIEQSSGGVSVSPATKGHHAVRLDQIPFVNRSWALSLTTDGGPVVIKESGDIWLFYPSNAYWAGGYRNPLLGAPKAGHTLTAQPGEIAAEGGWIDATTYPGSHIYAYSQENGLLVPSSNFVIGAHNFSYDASSHQVRIADLRNMFIRLAAGATDVDTANARALGSWREGTRFRGALETDGTATTLPIFYNDGAQTDAGYGLFVPIQADGTTPRVQYRVRPVSVAFYPRVHV